MVYSYDEAVVESIRNIMSDGRIHIVPPEDAFDLLATLREDKIKFPFISLRRPGWSLLEAKPEHMIFEGLVDSIDEENERVTRLQAIPIRIDYQIDIWSDTRLENDLILRELIFYYTLYPTLNVNIKYDDVNTTHHFNLFIDPSVEDNSDLTEFKNRGRYFRQTITMYTDDAYLWKSFNRKPNYVDPDGIQILTEGGMNL